MKAKPACQSCVPTFFARLLGFDVVARSETANAAAEELARHTKYAFIDKNTGTYPEYIHTPASTAKGFLTWLHSNLTQKNLYSIEFSWKKERKGHILTVQKDESGTVKLYDPQINETVLGDDKIKKYLENIKIKTINLMNISNCEINETVCKKIMKAAK